MSTTPLQKPPAERSGAGLKWLGEQDAQVIVNEIDEVAAAMGGCYKTLPPSAKASAIKLGHALSSLRAKLCRRIVAISRRAKR